jgi:hypothetical protein
MRPLGEYFVNHYDVRRDAEPHMYLENARNIIVAAMRAGQACAMIMRLRLGDHVSRHDCDVFGSTTPRAMTPRASDYAFAGTDLRDVLTHAPMPDTAGNFVLQPCMSEVIDWL